MSIMNPSKIIGIQFSILSPDEITTYVDTDFTDKAQKKKKKRRKRRKNKE